MSAPIAIFGQARGGFDAGNVCASSEQADASSRPAATLSGFTVILSRQSQRRNTNGMTAL
jgi:hypothetical protein